MENFVNSNAPISNQVADYLIDWVKKNGLKPGDKIPPELELVQILNTGRSSVREAIAILLKSIAAVAPTFARAPGRWTIRSA